MARRFGNHPAVTGPEVPYEPAAKSDRPATGEGHVGVCGTKTVRGETQRARAPPGRAGGVFGEVSRVLRAGWSSAGSCSRAERPQSRTRHQTPSRTDSMSPAFFAWLIAHPSR